MSPGDGSAAAGMPRTAAGLTALGVLPFAGGAALAWIWPDFEAIGAIAAVIAYGAVILSFLGGMHWGFAAAPGAAKTRTAVTYGLSVLPSLLGWAALLLPPSIGLGLLMLAVAGVLPLDRRAVALGAAPDWWMRLRLPVTGVVLLCLAATLVAVMQRF
jgi:hypothetical protein